MNKSIRFDVFGRQVLLIKTADRWLIYYLSGDGKRRPADDIMVPAFVNESELERYLADSCHEWATKAHPQVRRLN